MMSQRLQNAQTAAALENLRPSGEPAGNAAFPPPFRRAPAPDPAAQDAFQPHFLAAAAAAAPAPSTSEAPAASAAALIDQLLGRAPRAPDIVPASLPPLSDSLADTARRIQAALCGPQGMSAPMSPALLYAVAAAVLTVRYTQPPAPAHRGGWNSLSPSAARAAAVPRSFCPTSLAAFWDEWPRWQHAMWHALADGQAVIGAASALQVGQGMSTFTVTMRDLGHSRPWSEVALWLEFAQGLWRRTHLLLCVVVPGLWPWLSAHFTASSSPKLPPAVPSRTPAQPRPGPPLPRTGGRDVTADVPPRDSEFGYRCYDCHLVGWTSRCCPACHPTRRGADAWNTAFANGSQSRTVVTSRRVAVLPVGTPSAATAASSAESSAGTTANPPSATGSRRSAAAKEGKR